MTGLGFNLMRTGRMSLRPETIRRRAELRKILDTLAAEEKQEVTP